MTWTLIIYGIVPLVAFVLVDIWVGLKWAVVAAVVFAVLDVLVSYHVSGGIWDPGSIIAAVLILAFGIVATRRNDARYVKFQPVAVAAVFALLLAYYQFLGGGLVYHYLPLLHAGLPESMQPMLKDPSFVALMDKSVSGLIVVLLVHGAWVAYAALKLSNMTWLVVRGLGFWVVFFVYLIGFAIYQILSGIVAS